MTIRYLWINYTGTPTTYTEGGPITMGISFVPSVDGMAEGLRWYRGSTGAGILPQRLALWNRSSGLKVNEIVAPTDNGIVGWKEYTFGTAKALSAGTTYSITFDFAANQTAYRVAVGSQPTPDTNLAFAAAKRAYHSGAQNTYPEVTDSTFMNLVDVVFNDAGSSPPPATPASTVDVNAVMISWLKNGAGNDHPTDLPNITYTTLTDTSTGLPAINSAIADIATDMLTAESTVIGEIQSKLDDANSVLTTSLGPGGAFLTGALRTYLDSLKGTIDLTLSEARTIQGGPQGIEHATAEGWETVDTGTFEGSFFADVRCDRLYVHITTIGEERPTNEVEGFEFLTAPWPWYAIFANQVGSYQTSMAREAVLYVPGMRLDGVLVKLPPDCAGTWSAAMYTAP